MGDRARRSSRGIANEDSIKSPSKRAKASQVLYDEESEPSVRKRVKTEASNVPDKVNLFEKTLQNDKKLRLNYLLQSSEIFSHFIEEDSINAVTSIMDFCADETKTNSKTNSKNNEEEDQKNVMIAKIYFTFTPKYIKGEMRDYQVLGLNWLINLYDNGINGILADEMGLGKTLQTISLLGYMKNNVHSAYPSMVICPKSTISNWEAEFHRWCPSLNTLVLVGNIEERKVLVRDNILYYRNKRNFVDASRGCKDYQQFTWDVVITTYEMCIKEKSALKKILFGHLVIDEAHRIKNEKSKLSEIVREFRSRNRLLITGTPLQNNLHELWALLNFILPDIFTQSDNFDSWFNTDSIVGNSSSNSTNNTADQPEQKNLVSRLHTILQPFLLRRLKAEVEHGLLPKKETKIYVKLSPMQRTWYTAILMKDIDSLVNTNVKKANKSMLLNILMQLRKCCNHPYLFSSNRTSIPYEAPVEELLMHSGKLVVLDALLRKLKKENSRVLIFSQMVRMLDILEEYVAARNYEYCRIDGNTPYQSRKEQIEEFNAPDSEYFIFLLSTRAAGLGVNLATADVVVLYDSDWNPQMDLQAMDRAHRIGQKKQVQVFRFICENTVEERIIERAEMKLHLDHLVIQQGRLVNPSVNVGNTEILHMIKSSAEKVFASNNNKTDDERFEFMSDKEIELLLRQGETKTQEMKDKINTLSENALRNFSLQPEFKATADDESAQTNNQKSDKVMDVNEAITSLYNFEGQDYRQLKKNQEQSGGSNSIFNNVHLLTLPKRERRNLYQLDNYTGKSSNNSNSKNKPMLIDVDDDLDDVEFRLDSETGEDNPTTTTTTTTTANNTSSGGNTVNLMQIIKGIYDFQFYPREIYGILSSIKKAEETTTTTTAENGSSSKKASNVLGAVSEEQRKRLKELIISSVNKKDEREMPLAFNSWTKKDFFAYCKLLEKYTPYTISYKQGSVDSFAYDNTYASAIANEMRSKSVDEVEKYTEVFFTRMNELDDAAKIKNNLTKAHNKNIKRKKVMQFLVNKYDTTVNPLTEMKIVYNQNKGKHFSESEDRFILVLFVRIVDEFKLDPNDSRIYCEMCSIIKAHPRFRSNWFLKSRTPVELKKRCNTLIGYIEKEISYI